MLVKVLFFIFTNIIEYGGYMKDLKPLLNKLIAHRGIHNRIIKENSIESIELAVIKRIPVEFDITLTLDNIIVLSHNSYIKYDNKK